MSTGRAYETTTRLPPRRLLRTTLGAHETLWPPKGLEVPGTRFVIGELPNKFTIATWIFVLCHPASMPQEELTDYPTLCNSLYDLLPHLFWFNRLDLPGSRAL